MTTPKAQYKGDGPNEAVKRFSNAFLEKLRKYFKNGNPEVADDPGWWHPSVPPMAQVREAMAWAESELIRTAYDSPRSEIQAERQDLLKALRAAAKYPRKKIKRDAAAQKLRTLSRELDRRLSIDADPAGCASKIAGMPAGGDDAIKAIDTMIGYVEAAGPLIDQMSDELRPEQKQRRIAAELAMRVLRIIDGYGIRVTAVANKIESKCDLEPRTDVYSSDAVDLLKAIGDEIGLSLSVPTWRDVLSPLIKENRRIKEQDNRRIQEAEIRRIQEAEIRRLKESRQ